MLVHKFIIVVPIQQRTMFVVYAVVLSICVLVSRGDYSCLCNYSVEVNVYTSDDTNSKVLGYLYEFDCKPTYGTTAAHGVFQQIQFNNQIGFVETQNGLTVIQMCTGAIPSTDIVAAVSTKTSQASTSPLVTTNIHFSTRMTTSLSPVTMTTTTYSQQTSARTTVTNSQPITTKTTTTTTTATTTVSTVANVVVGCPDDWLKHHESCYLFVLDHKLNQQHASDECLKQDSHLVFVNSSNEQIFIHGYLEGMKSYKEDGRDELWIGGMDNVNEGTWLWKDRLTNTVSPFQYTYWDKDEPDSGNGDYEEDCVAIRGEHHYFWHDYRCSSQFYFICERSAYSNLGGVPILVG